jgi:hypothetical protein
VVTSLRGLEHGRFFQGMIHSCDGKVPAQLLFYMNRDYSLLLRHQVPAHVVVDGAAAWFAAREAHRSYCVGKSKSTTIEMAEGPMHIRRWCV